MIGEDTVYVVLEVVGNIGEVVTGLHFILPDITISRDRTAETFVKSPFIYLSVLSSPRSSNPCCLYET